MHVHTYTRNNQATDFYGFIENLKMQNCVKLHKMEITWKNM